jgi:hypothetical protein
MTHVKVGSLQFNKLEIINVKECVVELARVDPACAPAALLPGNTNPFTLSMMFTLSAHHNLHGIAQFSARLLQLRKNILHAI